MQMIDDVVEKFRQDLTVLVKSLENDSLRPERFREYVASLKMAINEMGLEVFTRTVMVQEEDSQIVEYGSQRHRFKLVSDKEWLTPWGVAVISRRYYQPDGGGEGVVPLDQRCGMAGRYMTPDVEEMTAYGAAMLVPREVERLLGRILPAGPSAKAVQRVISDVGVFAEKKETEIESAIATTAPMSNAGDVLVSSWDGVTVPLRERSSMMGRPAERPGIRTTNESPTAWKEAGVGTISIYGQTKDGPERIDGRYYARMPEPGMKYLLRQQEQTLTTLLEFRDFREKAILCDGKPAIWRAADQMEVYDDFTRILDFFHAAEHLSKAAEAIFGKQVSKATDWYEKYREQMRDEAGGVEAAIRSMRYHSHKLRRNSERFATVRRVIRYFLKNTAKMQYCDFKARGLPIGSGPVEAACKTVVGARLKRSGMRWSRPGGQHVLNLRVHQLSGRWDTFWNVYQQQVAA